MLTIAELKHHYITKKDWVSGYELFQRALIEQNQEAWSVIYELYQGELRRRIPVYIPIHEVSGIINNSWERFWKAISPNKARSFTKIEDYENYLYKCVRSAWRDYGRKVQKDNLFNSVELTEYIESNHSAIETVLVDEEFRSYLKNLFQPEEELIFQECFQFGLKPEQILTRYPDHPTIKTVEQIYQIKRNLLKRLRRNPMIKLMAQKYQ